MTAVDVPIIVLGHQHDGMLRCHVTIPPSGATSYQLANLLGIGIAHIVVKTWSKMAEPRLTVDEVAVDIMAIAAVAVREGVDGWLSGESTLTVPQ